MLKCCLLLGCIDYICISRCWRNELGFSSEKMAGHPAGEMEPRTSLTMQNNCAKMRLLIQSETQPTRKKTKQILSEVHCGICKVVQDNVGASCLCH